MIETAPYKARLEEEKGTLETELGTISKPNPAMPGEWDAVQVDQGQEPDPNDQADLLDEYQENRGITDVLSARHREVLEALAQIEAGTYGTCAVCGKEIEAERLEADPAAKTCKEHVEAQG